MNFDKEIKWDGYFEIDILENGKLKEKIPLKHNLITDIGLDLIRDVLKGTAPFASINFVALGNGTNAPAISNTLLQNELFRKQVSAKVSGTVGELITELYIADDEANSFSCKEIGWFGGIEAAADANTGIMIARVLFNRQKTIYESWLIRRIDTFGRA
jgi:hypothetical protein